MEEGYLEELRDKIDNKNLDEFWIACYKSDYSPMKVTKKELLDVINKNLNRYIGKHFAFINIFIKKGIKDYNIDHEEVFSIRTTIYKIGEDGKFIKNRIDEWSSLIKYDLFDILEKKFTLKDLYIIVRATYNRILETDGITGKSYKNMIKIFHKKNIEF